MNPFTLAVVAIRLLALYFFVVHFVLGMLYYMVRLAFQVRDVPISDWSLKMLTDMGAAASIAYCFAYLIIAITLYLNSVAIATRISRGLDIPATPSTNAA